MKRLLKLGLFSSGIVVITLVIAAGFLTTMAATSGGIEVTLTGKEEVPPVNTAATGKSTIVVSSDKSVSGSITTSGVEGTAAHIHDGARGKNGPVIVPLTKTSADTWTVPTGSKLTDAQYESYKAGNLYLNVHSAEHKGGEIRGQLSPK